MIDNTKLTGIKNRGIGSTSVGPSRIASIPVNPLGYENIVNTGQAMALEDAHVLMPSSAKEFILRARAKHEFLMNHSVRLLAVSQLDLLEAQSRIAGTLLNMKIELERRLNEPYGVSQFIGVAWSKTDPLAGLVESAYPFSHSDRWQEYVDRFQKAWALEKRHVHRSRRKENFPQQEAKAEDLDVKQIEKQVRGIEVKGVDGYVRKSVDRDKKRSKQRESNLPSQASIGIDAAIALIGEISASNAALAASLAAPIISVGFYFVSLGQAVQKQHRNAFVSGVRRGATKWVDQLSYMQGKQERYRRKTIYSVQFNGKVHLEREKVLCQTDPSHCWITRNLSTSAPASPRKVLAIRSEHFLRAFERMNIEVKDFETMYRDSLWEPLWEELQKISYQGNDFKEILDRVYRKHIGAARLKHMNGVLKVILDNVKF